MKHRFIIMTPCQKYNGMASSILPCKEKFEVQISLVKVMASICWDSAPCLLVEFFEASATIKLEWHLLTLRKLKRLQRVQPKKKVKVNQVLLHNVSVKGGTCNNGVHCSSLSSLQFQFSTL